MAVGIISHLPNLTLAQAQLLAVAAEAAGADWLGLPDAFWWRDSWMLLAEAARVTNRIGLGPLVTNPLLRHPFHTVAAVATLQDLAGDRVFVGLGAGGSEVSGAAGVSRREAPSRIRALAGLLRAVAAGAPLDPRSGRALEVPLLRATIVVAGRGRRILEAAGQTADTALLWAVPHSDLERSAGLIQAGAADGRDPDAGARRPEIVWAPLVAHDERSAAWARSTVAYSVLNSTAQLQSSWGLDAETVGRLRDRLVAGGAAAAASLVPAAALSDLIIADPDPSAVGLIAQKIGATSMALPAFTLDGLTERVAWARDVLATLHPT
jgi:alkanesulfonate monooxygenase SsuD/methylene tetrahydromethanopterin reductase-like flavin-dependent oxidoreductase (luciferase family)